MSAAALRRDAIAHPPNLSREEVEVVERQLGELIATARGLGDQMTRMEKRIGDVEAQMDKIQLLIAETNGMTRVLKWVAGVSSSFLVSGAGFIWWMAEKYQWFTTK